MIHLSPDFWTRRYIIIENHGIASAWEVVAVVADGVVCVGNWPESDSRQGTRVIPWGEVRSWYAYAEAAARYVERRSAA